VLFDDSGAVVERHAGEDGIPVLAEESSEAPHGTRPVDLRLADQIGEEMSSPVADQAGEDAGQVAGDAHLVELVLFLTAEPVARSHDP
jgi:hypothetical protein